MSVGNQIDALRDYVYRSQHANVLKDRAKWFEKMDKPYYCLWWIPAGHIPTSRKAASASNTTNSTAQRRIPSVQ